MKILNPWLSFGYKVEGQIMPVLIDKLNAGRKLKPLQVRILAFLKTNQNKGFSDNEIYEGLGYKTGKGFWLILDEKANLQTIHNAVDALVKEGIIETKKVKETVGEITYYMIA